MSKRDFRYVISTSSRTTADWSDVEGEPSEVAPNSAWCIQCVCDQHGISLSATFTQMQLALEDSPSTPSNKIPEPISLNFRCRKTTSQRYCLVSTSVDGRHESTPPGSWLGSQASTRFCLASWHHTHRHVCCASPDLPYPTPVPWSLQPSRGDMAMHCTREPGHPTMATCTCCLEIDADRLCGARKGGRIDPRHRVRPILWFLPALYLHPHSNLSQCGSSQDIPARLHQRSALRYRY